MQRLDELPLDKRSKETVGAILQAAANPNAERLDVVLATLPDERKRNVNRTTKKVSAVTKSVVRRASKALAAISDAEWNALIEAAENGE